MSTHPGRRTGCERAAAGEYSTPRGELVITATVVFGRLHVLPVPVEFLQAYPEVNVRLALGDRIVNLLEDHIDLALRIGTLPDSGLIATTLGSIRRVVCASTAYLAKKEAAASSSRCRGASMRQLRALCNREHVAFPSRRSRHCRFDSPAARRFHRRSGDRCGDLRYRGHLCALIPSRIRADRRPPQVTDGVLRARAHPGEFPLLEPGSPAVEAARPT